MDWAGVGRAVFPPDPYLSKFGTSGLPIGHLALNRPADSRIMHHAISDPTPGERRNDNAWGRGGTAAAPGKGGLNML
jgi:hypothetical protein